MAWVMVVVLVVRPLRVVAGVLVAGVVATVLALAIAGWPSWWAELPTTTAALVGDFSTNGGSMAVSTPVAPMTGEVTLVVEPPGIVTDTILVRDGWEVAPFDGGPVTVVVHNGDLLSLSTTSSLSTGSSVRVLAASPDVLWPRVGVAFVLSSGRQVLGQVSVRPSAGS